jgi:methionyl-tRNA formyltransferase
MKLVFFGTPEFAVPSLKQLLAHPAFEVLAVVTQPDKRRGRGNQLMPSPVKAVASSHELPVWQPKSVKKDAETLSQLRTYEADAFVVVAYGQILSQEILDMPRLGCINAHGSILPAYRGAAPIQWSLYRGDVETGITTMLMNAGMDTGPMLLKAFTPITWLDNAQTLAERLSQLSADLLVETLQQLAQQRIQPEPQDDAQATYAPLIQKSDYGLDWSRSAIALHHQIRGFFPNCTTGLRGEGLKVVASLPLDPEVLALLPTEFVPLQNEWATLSVTDGPKPPGSIVAILKGWGPIVKTGTGYLLLREVQLAGKRPQSGWDFANGTRLAVDEVLQTPTRLDTAAGST